MARPKSASDADILKAAHRVYAQQGARGFTLSQVAREVGISRAAIIQRFDSAQSLKLVLTRQMIHEFRALLDTLPVERSGDALLSLVHFIGTMITSREQQSAFHQNLHSDLSDEKFVELEEERKAAWYGAIAQRMPRLGIANERAVALFAAHFGGSIMQWQALPETGSASDFLVSRTRDWLKLCGVPYAPRVKKYPPFRKNSAD